MSINQKGALPSAILAIFMQKLAWIFLCYGCKLSFQTAAAPSMCSHWAPGRAFPIEDNISGVSISKAAATRRGMGWCSEHSSKNLSQYTSNTLMPFCRSGSCFHVIVYGFVGRSNGLVLLLVKIIHHVGAIESNTMICHSHGRGPPMLPAALKLYPGCGNSMHAMLPQSIAFKRRLKTQSMQIDMDGTARFAFYGPEYDFRA